MPTIQIEAHLSSEQLLNAARQMPRREFNRFVEDVLRLRAQHARGKLSVAESELVQQINQDLSPAQARRRKTLAAKRHAHTITETELQELIGLNDEAERLNVERVKHLIELAALRNVTLDTVMEQLGLNHQHHG